MESKKDHTGWDFDYVDHLRDHFDLIFGTFYEEKVIDKIFQDNKFLTEDQFIAILTPFEGYLNKLQNKVKDNQLQLKSQQSLSSIPVSDWIFSLE